MTIPAYPETYLPKARIALGDAFDYAVNVCGVPGDVFARLFVVGTDAARLERGDPSCVAGRSGIEIMLDVLREAMGWEPELQPCGRYARSEQWWVGWALAHCQWHSARTFAEILEAVSFDDFMGMYATMHEADVSKLVEVVERRLSEHFPETNLRRMRDACGCTQAELSRRSGVGLRSIQMYEQRNKDINKASAESVWRLAKALGCTVESLLER